MAERLEALFWKLHGAIDSRFPNFGIKPPQPPAEKVFERGNAHLLARLALLCAQSYKWTPSTFSSDMILQERTYFYVVFPRRNGALSWWPGALIWMPVSYIALLFSFAFVVSVLLAAAPIGWSMWHEQLLSMTPALEYVWQIIVSSVLWLLWLLSWPLAGLAWVFGALNWLVITFFTMLGGWLPAALVSLIEYSAMVAGVCVAWVLDHLVGFIALVVFRVPPSVQDWLQGHTDSWFPYFLYELRIVFGLALLLGSAIASILLFFPRLASGRAFGFVAPNRESATIIFCGSTFIDNFMINACVWLYPKPIRHRGFHRAWNHIKPDVEQWLATKVPKDAAIFMAGHYLRGAIAEIAAFDLAPEYPIGLVAAFGSSRIGNPKMRKLYKERLDKNGRLIHECTWHITHDDDTIPRLPPTGYFNHVGEGFLLSPVGRLYKERDPASFSIISRRSTRQLSIDTSSMDVLCRSRRRNIPLWIRSDGNCRSRHSRSSNGIRRFLRFLCAIGFPFILWSFGSLPFWSLSTRCCRITPAPSGKVCSVTTKSVFIGTPCRRGPDCFFRTCSPQPRKTRCSMNLLCGGIGYRGISRPVHSPLQPRIGHTINRGN